MTLIEGFRCIEPREPDEDVFVLCADSQETVTFDGREFRVSRIKVRPVICGNFEIAMGGSGSNGPLIDACVHRVEKRVRKFRGKTLAELEDFISSVLVEFGKHDARNYPKKERSARYLIAARSVDPPAVQVWHAEATELIPIERRKLIGWTEMLYEDVASRLYPDEGPLISTQQAILLAVYLVILAERTSNCVRRPSRVLVARRNKIHVLAEDKIASFEERISAFVAQMERVVLASADYTISRPIYEERLDEFKATLLQLRTDYLTEASPKTLQEMVDYDPPFQDLPRPFSVRLNAQGNFGSFTEDPEALERMRRITTSLQKHLGSFECVKCNLKLEYRGELLFDERGEHIDPGPVDWNCPECGSANKLPRRPLRYRKPGTPRWTEARPSNAQKSEPVP